MTNIGARRLELRVQPRPADAIVAIVWCFLRPGPIQLMAAGFGLYPAFLIAANMGMIKAGPWPFAMVFLGAALGIYMLFMGLELALLAVRFGRNTWRKIHFTPHRLVIDDLGLTSCSDFDSQKIAWKDVSAVQSGFGYVFVRHRSRKIMPIPLRDLGPELDRRQLLDRLQRVASRQQRIVAALTWVGFAAALFIAAKIVTGLFVAFTLDHQVQNGLRLAGKVPAAIERFRIERGNLPNSLAEMFAAAPDVLPLARDVYDEPLHYDRRGEAYVLVSYGRDRRPDGSDYWSTRETRAVGRDASPSRSHFKCRNPDADLVVSDRGMHQACIAE